MSNNNGNNGGGVDLVGEFISVPAWRVVMGCVIKQRPASNGTDDAVEVLVQLSPSDPHPRWYRLEPSEFTIDL